MDEEFEQEMYEQPDYDVWETNRVYEDMALEREEREAEALATADTERLSTIIFAALWSETDFTALQKDDIEAMTAAVITGLQAADITVTFPE